MRKATTKATTKATKATKATFENIKILCNDYIAESFTKSSEATAMLRASVVLYTIKSGYNYGLKDIVNDLPNLANYGEKTQKNLMRFAKDIRKNKRYSGKLSLESLKEWCLQSDIRSYYDNLVNPNRKKANSTPANSTPANSTPANSTPASSTPASVDAVKMFVEDSNLADLKRAYILIAGKLGIKLDESATKAILDIKKIAC